MDADERLTPELIDSIKKGIDCNEIHAFRYRRLNYFLGRPVKFGGWQNWNKVQLAQRDKHYYINAVHEFCVLEKSSNVGQLEGFMIHLNDDSYDERMRKSLQYSKIQAGDCFNKVSYVQVLIYPFLGFLKKYIFQFGILDGFVGLVYSMHHAGACFRKLIFQWELQNKLDNRDKW